MRLADSLLIKDVSMANAIDERVKEIYLARGSVIYPTPEESKYYMNMAGEYHPLDTPMQIVSLDTLETINFDRASLLVNRATRRAYTYDSRYYADLVARYPDQEFLIRGILNPVDKAKAIAAADYTILNYSKAEVEPNEDNLINSLQLWINTTVSRWWNRDYQLTDPLYPAAFMAGLVVNLAPAIMMIRKENIGTYKAHSFHIWNHLDSHGKLSKYRAYLTTKQKLWLYRNIKWVFANAGKGYTFEKLMDIILTHRGIPLAYYEHVVNTSDIADDIYAEPIMQRNPMNLLDQISPDPVFKTVRYVMEKEVPLARDNGRFLNDHYQDWMLKLSRSRTTRTITKVYESEVIDVSEQVAITLPEMLLNHWLYYSTQSRYPAVISVINPYTSQTIRMTTREALVLWVYALNKVNGIELTVIPKLDAYYVRRSRIPTKAQLMAIVDPKLVREDLVDQLIDEQVDVGVMISTEAFYETVKKIHTTYLRHRLAFEMQQHMDARGQVNAVVDRFYTLTRCNLTETPDETYDQYFDNRGWDFSEFARADFEILAEDLFDKATGSDIQSGLDLRDVQRAMLAIMKQLGTYATQYIQTIDAAPATVIGTVAVRVGDVDIDGFQQVKDHDVGTHALRMRATEKIKATFPLDKAIIDYSMSHSLPSEQVTLNPTVRVGYNSRPVDRVRLLQSYLQISTDLTPDVGNTEWANIPNLNVEEEVYIKTISPSTALPITAAELGALDIDELRLHYAAPGTDGESNELSSLRYTRQFAMFDVLDGNRRSLLDDVVFEISAGDVVSYVSYWSQGEFIFSIPSMRLVYPIDGILTVDSETTYLESGND